MEHAMGGRDLQRSPSGIERGLQSGTHGSNYPRDSLSSRSTTITTSLWARRVFHSVCVPRGVSTVRGRGGAAPEAGVHGGGKRG